MILNDSINKLHWLPKFEQMTICPASQAVVKKHHKQIFSSSPSNYTVIWFHVVPKDYDTKDNTEHIDTLYKWRSTDS